MGLCNPHLAWEVGHVSLHGKSSAPRTSRRRSRSCWTRAPSHRLVGRVLERGENGQKKGRGGMDMGAKIGGTSNLGEHGENGMKHGMGSWTRAIVVGVYGVSFLFWYPRKWVTFFSFCLPSSRKKWWPHKRHTRRMSWDDLHGEGCGSINAKDPPMVGRRCC